MKTRTLSLLALVLVASCVERALDGTAPGPSTDGGVVDLARRDLSGADLSGFNPPPIDLATPPDLAASVGVWCNGAICDQGDVCCALSGMLAGCVPAGFGGMDNCPFGGDGFRCDGPEDCRMGRRCVGEVMADQTIDETRCREQPRQDELVICHGHDDCDLGFDCFPVESLPIGAVELGACYPIGPL
jgi:hypothetical protein